MPDGTGVAEGQGITLSFASSSVTLNILDVNYSGISRTDIDISDQGTTGLRRYIPSTLAEGGDVTFNVNWNLQDQAALYTLATSTTAENITITYPFSDSATNSDAADDVFSGYVKNITKSGSEGSLINGSVVIKVADDITFDDESV